MQEENNSSDQFQPDIYQQGRRIIFKEIRHNENSTINQEIQQTAGNQICVSAEYTLNSQEASENEGSQLYDEQITLENVKSNIWTCSIKTAEDLRKLIVTTENHKKQVEELVKVQESRKKNVSEAKHQNEAMSLELEISQRNTQALEAQVALIHDVCTELQQHCIPTAAALENCVQAKDCIVHYYEHIKKEVRADDELCKMQEVQLRNKEEQWRLQIFKEMEERKKEKILAEKVRMEMDQKIEEVMAKMTALQQNNVTMEDRIREKTAKKGMLVSKMMQELQEVNEKVNRAQQKNEELTVNKEVLMNHAAKLETSLQDMSNDREFWKNNELNLQQTIDEARKRKQVVSGELEQVKARVIALEMENHELDCVLQRKRDLKAELTSQLEQCELEVQDMEGVLCKLQDSCERKQEDIKGLQEQLQANQLEQETLISEYKSKIMEIMAVIESEKKKLCDMDSELQRGEQTASELLGRLKEIRTSNSSMEQECEVFREEIAKTRSRSEELQVLAKEETDRKQKIEEELRSVEISLQELQSSLAESCMIHEEFMLQVTRDKTETDEELQNAQCGLQNSNANYDCMVQEIMTLVNESRQSYAQHIEMKEAALTACKNEFCSLTKQVEEASAEKDRLEAKLKDELKALEDTVNQLEEKISKKKADNQLQASSTPITWMHPQSEQVSSSVDQQFPRGILKSPIAEAVINSKQVQFFGLSSDSDSSLFNVPKFPNTHAKSVTVKKGPASKYDRMSYVQKKQLSHLPDSPENISKTVPARKFFKSRSQPTIKTDIQTVQDSPDTYMNIEDWL